jgi:hypothetical protein
MPVTKAGMLITKVTVFFNILQQNVYNKEIQKISHLMEAKYYLQKQMMFTKKSVLYSVTYDAMVLEEP